MRLECLNTEEKSNNFLGLKQLQSLSTEKNKIHKIVVLGMGVGMYACTQAQAYLNCVLVLWFVMGYVLQFGEIAHKRIYYYNWWGWNAQAAYWEKRKQKTNKNYWDWKAECLKTDGEENKQKHLAGTDKVVMLNKWQERKQPTGVDEVGMFDNWEQTNKKTYWGWWGWNAWPLRKKKKHTIRVDEVGILGNWEKRKDLLELIRLEC